MKWKAADLLVEEKETFGNAVLELCPTGFTALAFDLCAG